MVLAEFLDLVDDKFREETTDEILKGCPLESGGADDHLASPLDVAVLQSTLNGVLETLGN